MEVGPLSTTTGRSAWAVTSLQDAVLLRQDLVGPAAGAPPAVASSTRTVSRILRDFPTLAPISFIASPIPQPPPWLENHGRETGHKQRKPHTRNESPPSPPCTPLARLRDALLRAPVITVGPGFPARQSTAPSALNCSYLDIGSKLSVTWVTQRECRLGWRRDL
ncbi:hypothetical protein GCM10014715_42120 [Streptomyces spiralis]|uniref:Uncharacterized protein n=1 Tax=Streptomyces spiralis TaxID=66376 RepID=A0A919DUY4_9ACTN|nr:hypothetical protein GCM10014715_42120 [Streptomyces spiralis]